MLVSLLVTGFTFAEAFLLFTPKHGDGDLQGTQTRPRRSPRQLRQSQWFRLAARRGRPARLASPPARSASDKRPSAIAPRAPAGCRSIRNAARSNAAAVARLLRSSRAQAAPSLDCSGARSAR